LAEKPELARWMSRQDLKAKFADCAVAALGTRQLEELFNRFMGIDGNVACDGLFAALQGRGRLAHCDRPTEL